MLKLLADENFDNTIIKCSLEGELEGQVQYIPL
jgi:hypothetical protein